MKRFVIRCSIFLLLGLTACGTTTQVNEETVGGEQIEEPAVEPDKEPDSRQEPNQEEDTAAPGASDASDVKDIPVYVEGETEMRTAQFHRSELGYGVYVLEDYKLESEEPNRDVIISQLDESFFTRVTTHGTEVNADELKQAIIDHANGEITKEIDVPLDGVEYAFLEEVTSNDQKTSVIHVAKEYEGQLVGYTVFLPLKEAVEGIGPSMWAMLDTVEF
ncbi:hypothetical protein [Halalkalibacter nanhaiisediminis]|uniref:Lipoprotein n=1 Tax=Halalkalibacter nanhaiisediminis TaxID=688079 RepID=A0A562QR16_9BACI|nr:hypothetical protein [Halalkalibacter nanhaiisediminis]TWI59198.1 hypothetical protein IQ10_00911 [Halalkalibacter nanhaiisediminis]